MEKEEIKQIIEGLLFVSGDDGISLEEVSKIIEIDNKKVKQAFDSLQEEYEQEKRGMIIINDEAVYSFSTRPEHKRYFQKYFKTPEATRLSQAALETLGIIAYKQPITRAEIEEIRGVKSERPIQTLISRALIAEVGRKETIGRPILYGTTKEFLLFFGLTSLEELPELMEDLLVDLSNREEVDLFS